MKSKLKKTGINTETLYNEKAYVIKRLKTGVYIEFVKFWNWSKDMLFKHPEFRQYTIQCIGLNKHNIECYGSLIKAISETDFYFTFCDSSDLELAKKLRPVFIDDKIEESEAHNLITATLYN